MHKDDVFCGWLVKRGEFFKRDKRRFFRLTRDAFKYYHYESDAEAVPGHAARIEWVTGVTFTVSDGVELNDPRRFVMSVSLSRTEAKRRSVVWTLYVPSMEEVDGWKFAFKQVELYGEHSDAGKAREIGSSTREVSGTARAPAAGAADEHHGASPSDSRSEESDGSHTVEYLPVTVELPRAAGSVTFSVGVGDYAAAVCVRDLKYSFFRALAVTYDQLSTRSAAGGGAGAAAGGAAGIASVQTGSTGDRDTAALDWLYGAPADKEGSPDTTGPVTTPAEPAAAVAAEDGDDSRRSTIPTHAASETASERTALEEGEPMLARLASDLSSVEPQNLLEPTDVKIDLVGASRSMRDGIASLLRAGPQRFVLKTVKHWLNEEDFYLRALELRPSPDGAAHLFLLPKDALPLVHSRIMHTREARDAFNKPYTAFCVKVRFDSTQWAIWRRYNDFKKLHEDLAADPSINSRSLPRLPPPKHTARRTVEFVEHRRAKLDRYLQGLLSVNEVAASVPLMSFLGVLSTARHDRSDDSRKLLHVTRLNEFVQPGDILLFACNNVLSGLQRTVTRSEWDHIAIVCSQHGTILSLVEATGEGVGARALVPRVRSYGAGAFTKAIAVRRVEGLERTTEVLAKLRRFVADVDGKPYKLNPSKLFRRKGDDATAHATDDDKSTAHSPEADSATQRDASSDATVPSAGGAGGAGGSAAPSPAELAEAVLEPNGTAAGLADAVLEPRDTEKARAKIRTVVPPENFFCSELVAHALQVLGVLSTAKAPSAYWPADFGTDGAVEGDLVDGVRLGPETLIDCRVLEVARAGPVGR